MIGSTSTEASAGRPRNRSWRLGRSANLLFAPFLLALICGVANAQVVADFTATPLSGTQPLTVAFTDATTGGSPNFAIWDFGDGQGSNQINPVHVYKVTQTTSFTVTYLAITPNGADTVIKTDLITVSPATIVVDFTATAVAGTNPLTVTFSDLTTGAPVNVWNWNFGDGATSNLPNPTHTYTSGSTPTSYNVSLSIKAGAQQGSINKPNFITVNPAPLIVDFAVDVSSGDPPLSVNFTDLSSGAVVTAWSWDFGDGNSSTLQDPSHVYSLPGDWDVTLTAFVGAQPVSLTKPDFISVNPTFALNADFSSTPVSGDHPLAVNFTNLSTGDLITGYLWDFGDGATSTSVDPIHIYSVTEETSFDVSLTAFTGGQTDTIVYPGLIQVLFPWLVQPIASTVGVPQDLASTDLNGDGAPDLLVAYSGTNQISWFENADALGNFEPEQLVIGGTLDPYSIETADLDGDGDRDVLATTSADGKLTWYENLDARGSFGQSQLIDQYLGGLVGTVVAADLDGDGDQDVVARGGWYENANGSNQFQLADGFSFFPRIFAAADVDLDGDLDVFSLYDSTQKVPQSETVNWDRNSDGLGTFVFGNQVAYICTNSSFPAGSIAAADFDLDGDVDLTLAIEKSVYAQRNQDLGSGVFSTIFGHFPQLPSKSNSISVADIDGDSLPDFVIGLPDTDQVVWFKNEFYQAGISPLRVVTTASMSAGGVLCEDLDDDGDLDVVAFSQATNSLAWYQNSLASPDWPYLGKGLPGAMGNPVLSGSGELSPGSEVSIALTNAIADMPALLIVGNSQVNLSILGGTLVPFPKFKLHGLSTNSAGEILWDLNWPPELAPETPLYFQYWLIDASAIEGWSASNGIRSSPPR